MGIPFAHILPDMMNGGQVFSKKQHPIGTSAV